MSTQFGNNLNQKILLSRKENSPYTNTLVAINKVWTMKPESPMGMPKLQNKGGMSMWYDSTLVVTSGLNSSYMVLLNLNIRSFCKFYL